MASFDELQKKFHDHRRWAADLLLKSETLFAKSVYLINISNWISEEEEIEALSSAVTRLTAELEQVKKESLSARQE